MLRFANIVTPAALLALALTASTAAADERHWFGGSVEGFASKNLDDPNYDRYGFGAGGALWLELRPWEIIGFHFGGTGAWYSANEPVEDRDGDGTADTESSTYFAGGAAGMRLHWSQALLDSKHDAWVDLHFLYGAQEGFKRPGMDAGIGYEHALNERGTVRLGPFARFAFLTAPSTGLTPSGDVISSEAPFWLNVGVSLGFGHGRKPAETEPVPPPPPADRDGDGVNDSDDFCPDTPEGNYPDPGRPGCPLLDVDRDGVLNAQDQCPEVHQGDTPDPARPGCPEPDTDGDGLLDSKDACPEVAAGPHPNPELPGCPEADSDKDRIADRVDACPRIAGAPNRDPQKHGCPSSVREIDGRFELYKQNIYFPRNRARIKHKSYPVIKDIADVLHADTSIQLLRIEGHTCNTGPDDYNMKLSYRRARAVRRALIGQGIDPARIEVVGNGEEQPISDNASEEGREMNRRVEFEIVR